jgi:hypothetical protein
MLNTLRHYLSHEFAWLIICAATVFPQAVPTAILTGTVFDDSTSAALDNANVFLNQTTLGSVTDERGRFEIRNVPLGSYELVASRLGYQMSSIGVLVTQSNPEPLKITLWPRSIEMNEVAVAATEPRDWKVQLEKFKTSFFGESELAREVKLLNPEVLDFESDEHGSFIASARAPLEIENRPLGYRIRFILVQFKVGGIDNSGRTPEIFQMRGFSQFTELKPNGSEDLQAWKKNREKSYEGSLRHFLSCVFRRRATAAGFQFYREPRVITSASNILRRRVIEDDILSGNAQQRERLLRFRGFLEVQYTRAIPDAHYNLLEMEGAHCQVSWLGLNRDSITIDSRGLIREPSFPVVTYGYWAWQRMANVLPLDYEPDAPASFSNDMSPTASPPTSSCIIPLAIGNRWTMHISDRNALGKVTSFRIETTEILSDTIVDGERWFLMNNSGHNSLCTNRPDGFYELRGRAKLLRFKYPANIGDRYQGADGETYVVSVDEHTSVPKGSFISYQYKVTRVAGLRTYVCCSPGVGIVNVEVIMINTETARYESTRSSELVDYTLH